MGLLSSCSLFFGNIRSTEEKSSQYTVEELTQLRPHWKKISPSQDSEVTESTRPDLTFESIRTSSVISLTSGCKTRSDSRPAKNLSELTRVLLLGISDLKYKTVCKRQIEKVDALWSSVSGEVNHEPVAMEVVVFQRGDCSYDLILVGRPPLSPEDQDDFAHFVSTFHFK